MGVILDTYFSSSPCLSPVDLTISRNLFILPAFFSVCIIRVQGTLICHLGGLFLHLGFPLSHSLQSILDDHFKNTTLNTSLPCSKIFQWHLIILRLKILNVADQTSPRDLLSYSAPSPPAPSLHYCHTGCARCGWLAESSHSYS